MKSFVLVCSFAWSTFSVQAVGQFTTAMEHFEKKEYQKAELIFRQEATSDNVAAYYYLGKCCSESDRLEEAVKWYQKGAELKDPAAQNGLAWCYQNGLGVYVDLSEAIRLYRLSAEQDFPKAMSNLGYCYSNGIGVKEDHKIGFEWFSKAAEKHNPYAEYAIGFAYFYGLGVEENREKCA
ncbi:Secretory immunoglobulin A-binding protein EsiB [Pontiella desulfatans]|uniref:Secretory immunoglobulin A-binding protein EsiB n=2 Tax=Pontiella desulfatans TaxID=2750659 RepID=A0A6C2UAS8_PONDE|nr:Secretory immunoglobulin A-binding protein EsiB [Pontiella desulfatans]